MVKCPLAAQATRDKQGGFFSSQPLEGYALCPDNEHMCMVQADVWLLVAVACHFCKLALLYGAMHAMELQVAASGIGAIGGR